MSQPHLRQQPASNDISLLQKQYMLKQLQQRREEQLQQFVGIRPHMSMDQLPITMKQSAAAQFPPLINGTPVQDTQQIFMDWMPRNVSPSAQGVPNGIIFSPEQCQAVSLLSLSPQQPDASLYGAPIARGHPSQGCYLQGVSGGSANLVNRADSNQAKKPIMQPNFGNSFLVDQGITPQEHGYIPDQGFAYKQGFKGRKPFGQVHLRGLCDATSQEGFEQGKCGQTAASAQDHNVMHGYAGLPGLLLEKMPQIGSSQGMVALDPIEQKILFSTDENFCDASFGRHTNIASETFGNLLENPDLRNPFPYSQGGSYSALMQSAVAEASSTDTGFQEEWSGLTFQNMEFSTENQPSNFVDSGKQQMGWADNSRSASSFCSKLSPVINDSSIASTFQGMKQSASPYSSEQREGVHNDSPHESIEQSSINDSKCFNLNLQKLLVDQVVGKSHDKFDNSSRSLNYSYRGEEEIFDNRQNCYLKENSSADSYNSNSSHRSVMGNEVLCQQVSSGIGNHEHGYYGHLESTGRVSNSIKDPKKGQLPEMQGEVASTGSLGSDIYALEDSLDGFRGSSIINQTRQPWESSSTSRSLSQAPKDQNADRLLAVQCDQPYASCKPQRLPNANDLSSFQGPPHIENSPPVVTSGTPYYRSQLHGESSTDVAQAHKSSHSTCPGPVNTLPSISPSQDTSQLISVYPSGQKISVSEVFHASHPANMLVVCQQDEYSIKAPYISTNMSSQNHHSAAALHEVLRTETSKNSLETPLVQRQLNDLILPKDGNESSVVGANLANLKVPDHEEERGKERPNCMKVSEVLNSKGQAGDSFQQKKSAASSLGTNLHKKLQYVGNQAPVLSRRDCDAFGRSLRPSLGLQQNYSLLHQVQAMNHLNVDPIQTITSQNIQQAVAITGPQSFHGHARIGKPIDSEMHAASRINLYPFGDNRQQSLRSRLQSSSGSVDQNDQETCKFSGIDCRSHSSSIQVACGQRKNPQFSVQMAPNGSFKTGHMLLVDNLKTERLSAEPISLGKPSEILHVGSNLKQNACGSHVDGAGSSTAANLVKSAHLQPSYIWTSGVADQTLNFTRPKRRKIETSVLQPWHKEVICASETSQDISISKQCWAQATNRLVEKMDDLSTTVEDKIPLIQSKKRLAMTTHLMQHLIQPVEPAILHADAKLNFDSTLYYVARLALGNACSLTSHMRRDSDGTMILERRINNRDLVKASEFFSMRAKKLKNNLLRVEQTTSLVDVRLQCQELEKYSVMNRFAKFHGRVQGDARETASSSRVTAAFEPSPMLRRCVIAVPVPKILPEQTRCLSL